MIVTTTHGLDGRQVERYLGIVTGEAILGANLFRDLFAGIRDIVGGRSAAYEKELARARDIAIQEMVERAQQIYSESRQDAGWSGRRFREVDVTEAYTNSNKKP